MIYPQLGLHPTRQDKSGAGDHPISTRPTRPLAGGRVGMGEERLEVVNFSMLLEQHDKDMK